MRLRGGPWHLEVMPERGGRITSLRLDDEELFDQGIGVDDPSAEGFVAAGARGWDEMVPNVDASRYPGSGAWGGLELPDHGEAWRLPWAVLDSSADSVVMSCSGRVLPWDLERNIRLRHDAVRLSYVLRNGGGQPLYGYWCAHPLFRYEVGMEIGVEGGADLAQLAEGASTKVFLTPGSVDRVRLGWRSGLAVEVAWDPELTPYVGVWVCNGDLGGYRHVAVEPATGGSDRPDPRAAPPLLDPGQGLRWWVEVRDVR